jgi:hypothetical protein
MAGYSGKPLIEKLGLVAEAVAYMHHPPAAYWDWISPLPEGVVVKKKITAGLNFVHLHYVDCGIEEGGSGRETSIGPQGHDLGFMAKEVIRSDNRSG